MTVTVSGIADPKWMLSPVDPSAMDQVSILLHEYDRRDLAAMLGAGSYPTAWGFANILMERLVMVVPGIVSVEVEESDGPIALIERDVDH